MQLEVPRVLLLLNELGSVGYRVGIDASAMLGHPDSLSARCPEDGVVWFGMLHSRIGCISFSSIVASLLETEGVSLASAGSICSGLADQLIKCALDQAWLLKEFFSQIANPMALEKRIGMFIPTRAVHIIGQAAYTNLLCANNEFLQSIAMVSLGDFQHATLEIPFSDDPNTNIEQTNLYEMMLKQDWCINVELSMTPNKNLLITTKSQVQNARKWADDTLPALYNQHISDKLDVTTLQQMTP